MPLLWSGIWAILILALNIAVQRMTFSWTKKSHNSSVAGILRRKSAMLKGGQIGDYEEKYIYL